MIKEPETSQFKMNVKLKSGEYFKNKDVTPEPFGDDAQMVSFWQNDKIIRIYPLKDIEYCELVLENT